MSTPFRSKKKATNATNTTRANNATNWGIELGDVSRIPSGALPSSSIRPPTAPNAFIAASRASAIVNDHRRADVAAAEEARRVAAAEEAAAEEVRRIAAAEEAAAAAAEEAAAEKVRRIAAAEEAAAAAAEEEEYRAVVRMTRTVYNNVLYYNGIRSILHNIDDVLKLIRSVSKVSVVASIDWDKYFRDISETLNRAEGYHLLRNKLNKSIERYVAELSKYGNNRNTQDLLITTHRENLQLDKKLDNIRDKTILIILKIYTEIFKNAPPQLRSLTEESLLYYSRLLKEREARVELNQAAEVEADRITEAIAAARAVTERMANAEAKRMANAEAERIAEAKRIANIEAERIAKAERISIEGNIKYGIGDFFEREGGGNRSRKVRTRRGKRGGRGTRRRV